MLAPPSTSAGRVAPPPMWALLAPEPTHSLQWGFCRPCAQMPEPPHSLHRFFLRPCAQMPEPPHSLHTYFSCPCAQKREPPHSLQLLLRRPCAQMPAPPHSLQLRFCRPCAQMSAPRHSLQTRLCRLCSQMPAPPHSLQLDFCRPRARRCPHLRTPCSCASAVRVGKQAASSARHGHMLHSSFVHERILCSCVAARLLHPAPSLRSLRRPCPLRSARFSRRNTGPPKTESAKNSSTSRQVLQLTQPVQTSCARPASSINPFRALDYSPRD